MEKLDSFNFDERPSRSRYAPVVKALVEDGTFAVALNRGEPMFPEDVKIDSVIAGVRTAVSKAGKRTRIRRAPLPDGTLSNDRLVVGLDTEPAPRRRSSRKREAAVL